MLKGETYLEFALRAFAGNKLAIDLAKLLENDKVIVGSGRETVFNIFCAICKRTGVVPPPLEERLWRPYLPKVHDYDLKKNQVALENAIDVRDTVNAAVGENNQPAAITAKALAETLVQFPTCIESYNGITARVIMATINHLLVDELHMEPIRPDYLTIEIPAMNLPDLDKPTRIVIIDDDPAEIIKSALAMIGIPGVEIIPFLHEKGNDGRELTGSALRSKLQEVASSVMALKPDVVFMDMGLINIKGSDLVRTMKESGGGTITYVANTGGTPDELYSVGCLSNFRKGEEKNTLRNVIRLRNAAK